MKKNTKINAIILALAVCMLATGCGNSDSSSSSKKTSSAETTSSSAVTYTDNSSEQAEEEASSQADESSESDESSQAAEESSQSKSKADSSSSTASSSDTKKSVTVTEKSESTTQTQTVKKSESTSTAVTAAEGSKLDVSDMFTDRDLEQTADTSEAKTITAENSKTVEITEAGVYVISGTAKNFTVKVNAGDDDKVQLVLDGASITNDSTPAIYVVNADKVFVTTASDSTLSVTGTFTADGDTNTDAVIFSKDDIVLNGTATLTINSTDHGISGKDDLKITGGTYVITSTSHAIEANDSVRISGGKFTIKSSKDGIHCENSDDNTVGYVYISGGTFDITASSDGIQATTVAQIDGGTINISAAEGIEATYVQINSGKVTISANDDGVNAAQKTTAETVTFEMTGGELTITMASGDTDAIDSNGNVKVSGGTINITCPTQGTAESFDYDGTATYTGGTIIINGEQVDSIPTPMMMGGGMGGFGGGQQMGGGFGGQRGGRR